MSDTVRNGTFTRTNSFDGDRDPVQPRFHHESVKDELASQEQGRPIFRDELRVQFIMPASPNQPVMRVTQEHIERWPKQYEAFMRGGEMAVEGTPLEQWPIMTRAMVLELKALGLYSVEQCAMMPDTAVQKVGRGGYAIRERAKAYLDEAESLAFSERLNAENEKLTSRVSAQDHQIDELKQLVDRLHGQVMAMQNAPNVIETHMPRDPMEAARQALPMEAPAQSALDAFEAPRKPRKAA